MQLPGKGSRLDYLEKKAIKSGNKFRGSFSGESVNPVFQSLLSGYQITGNVIFLLNTERAPPRRRPDRGRKKGNWAGEGETFNVQQKEKMLAKGRRAFT